MKVALLESWDVHRLNEDAVTLKRQQEVFKINVHLYMHTFIYALNFPFSVNSLQFQPKISP